MRVPSNFEVPVFAEIVGVIYRSIQESRCKTTREARFERGEVVLLIVLELRSAEIPLISPWSLLTLPLIQAV